MLSQKTRPGRPKRGAKKSTGSPAVRSAARKPQPPGSHKAEARPGSRSRQDPTRQKRGPEAGSPLPHFKCFHKRNKKASPKTTEQKPNTQKAQKLSPRPAQAPKSQCRTLSGPTGVEFYTPQKTQKKSKKALDKQEQRE